MSRTEPPRSHARVWIAALAIAGYAALVLAATMWPTPLDQGFAGSIDRLLGILHRNGMPEWFGYNKLEFAANVLMFVPLGFLTSILLPARIWWLALICCPALSVVIELTQAQFLSARFATVTDVAANTIGALIGAVLAVGIRAALHGRDEKMIAYALWKMDTQR